MFFNSTPTKKTKQQKQHQAGEVASQGEDESVPVVVELTQKQKSRAEGHRRTRAAEIYASDCKKAVRAAVQRMKKIPANKDTEYKVLKRRVMWRRWKACDAATKEKYLQQVVVCGWGWALNFGRPPKKKTKNKTKTKTCSENKSKPKICP